MRLGHSQNLAWTGLVLRHTFPDGPPRAPASSFDNETNKASVDTLFELLAEFLAYREANGLQYIQAAFSEMFA